MRWVILAAIVLISAGAGLALESIGGGMIFLGVGLLFWSYLLALIESNDDW